MRAAYYCGDRKVEVGACEIQAPEPGEVRIEVAYCGVCGTDLHIYMGHMDGRIDIEPLITHTLPGREADKAYHLLHDSPDEALGVVLDWEA